MNISNIMKSLPKSEYDSLMAAFEEGIPRYFEYTRGRYIGVYTDELPHLTCFEQAGYWREGIIKRD